MLPAEVQYPTVVASGVETFGEWIVVRHRPGTQLSEAWASLDEPTRRLAVHDVAHAIRAVHTVSLTLKQQQDLVFSEGEGLLALPHQLPASRILRLIDQAAALPWADQRVLEEARRRTEEVRDVIWDHEGNGLVHGDLHFENVLAANGIIIALVDFEWSRQGPAEIDVDMLARFCANPKLHVGGYYPIEDDDFKDVLWWFAEAYPELFEADFFKERLFLCALSFELPWLLRVPPEGPINTLHQFHPMNQIKELLEKGTHAERLGWTGPNDRYTSY